MRVLFAANENSRDTDGAGTGEICQGIVADHVDMIETSERIQDMSIGVGVWLLESEQSRGMHCHETISQLEGGNDPLEFGYVVG